MQHAAPLNTPKTVIAIYDLLTRVTGADSRQTRHGIQIDDSILDLDLEVVDLRLDLTCHFVTCQQFWCSERTQNETMLLRQVASNTINMFIIYYNWSMLWRDNIHLNLPLKITAHKPQQSWRLVNPGNLT